MDATYQDKIRSALSQLDPANDTHWTDDGLPATRVVQALANDGSVKRSDINEAAPGFDRKAAEQVRTEQAAPAAEPAVEAPAGVTTNGDGEMLTEEEVRAILDQHVVDCEAALFTARDNISKANAAAREAAKALDEARIDRVRRFPPLTAAENIKQYLRSEQEKRAAAHNVRGPYGKEQIDAVMERRNSRGWRRPSRPVNAGTEYRTRV